MSEFSPLLAELYCWQDASLTAMLWLRDDDAMAPNPKLDRLLNLGSTMEIPLVLAVVPLKASPDLAVQTAQHPMIHIWQHGINHTNNAPAGSKKQELIGATPLILEGLEQGLVRLQEMFGTQFLAVLVPPWNRITDGLLTHLSPIGLVGLSTFKPRPTLFAANGLIQVNTHVDLIYWRGERRFVGAHIACQAIADHLRARRLQQVDIVEPTGILSHHAVMEDDAWGFLSDLFAIIKRHPAARWCAPLSEQSTAP